MEKAEQWPLDVEISIRFSSWKYYRMGIIRKDQAQYICYYREPNGKPVTRQVDSVHVKSIILPDGSEWNIHSA
jgi:hypothetical protein